MKNIKLIRDYFMMLAQMQLLVHLLSRQYWCFSAFTTFHYFDSYVNKVPDS